MLHLEEFAGVLSKDPQIRSMPQFGRCSIRFDLGSTTFIVRIGSELSVQTEVGINDSWDFSFSIPEEAWEQCNQSVPPPGYNTAQALVARLGPEVIGGDRRKWAQYAPVVQRVLQLLTPPNPAREAPPLSRESQIVGRYVTVDIAGTDHRIYFESAGEGVPLLCLHTAGCDSRQYRYLLEDPEVTENFQVIAFDMPWHGRSSPPADWRGQHYELTVESYSTTVLAVCDALGLDGAVLMGCSMGGWISLYMASVYGERFSGVIALEGALGNPSRRVVWTRHHEVDHSLFLSTWVDGLMSPNSPAALKEQILWEYSQSGPGVYNGDTNIGVDFPRVVAQGLEPATCPLWVFCGDYDYSSTPASAQAAAELLGGEFILMEGMGHFPMAEDPVGLKAYLMPVLGEILGQVQG